MTRFRSTLPFRLHHERTQYTPHATYSTQATETKTNKSDSPTPGSKVNEFQNEKMSSSKANATKKNSKTKPNTKPKTAIFVTMILILSEALRSHSLLGRNGYTDLRLCAGWTVIPGCKTVRKQAAEKKQKKGRIKRKRKRTFALLQAAWLNPPLTRQQPCAAESSTCS